VTILAYPPNALTAGLLENLREDYGFDLPIRVGGPVRRTLIGHIDREGSNDLRAGRFKTYPEEIAPPGDPFTVVPIPLTDGRHAVAGEWSPAFIAALSTDSRIAAVDILTQEQFQALLPFPTDIQ
jgi:hypothetical protein